MRQPHQIAVTLFLAGAVVLFSTTAHEISPGFAQEQVLTETSTALTTQEADPLRRAEVRRLDAERRKLELESEEIERRLNARWWEAEQLTRYGLAIVIAAALLFGWVRLYLQPILSKQSELNELAAQRNSLFNQVLEAQNDRIREEQREITEERDQLRIERGDLNASLLRQNSIAAGLELLVDQGDEKVWKLFSILNTNDPITDLKHLYGWDVWIDNFFGKLSYYQVIEHPKVRSGKRVIVTRIFELEKLKRDLPNDWREYIRKINERDGPLLALDYSYVGLLADKDLAVGGRIYRLDGDDIEFYAPLGQWSSALAELFSNE